MRFDISAVIIYYIILHNPFFSRVTGEIFSFFWTFTCDSSHCLQVYLHAQSLVQSDGQEAGHLAPMARPDSFFPSFFQSSHDWKSSSQDWK